MPELVVETTGLRKEHAPQRGLRVPAVVGLDLSIAAGSVHALLGPDGSGRTTTLRMLLGLSAPTAGTIRLFGREVPSALSSLSHRIGAIVGTPAFSPNLTARRNLELLAGAAGVEHSRVTVVAAQVGLADRLSVRCAGYSAVERRLLALASALLRESDLLILDEPTRGLDPASADVVRRLVAERADGGCTVLLSTTDVAEVHQLCDSVTLLADGEVEDLVGETRSRTRVGVAEPERAAHLLTGAGYDVVPQGRALLVEGHDAPAAITRLLADNGVYVEELTAVRPDLEGLFADLSRERRASQEESA